MKTHLVVAAIGRDRHGLVNELAKVVFEHSCNMLDSRMTVMGSEFASIVLVEGKLNNIAKLEDAFPVTAKQLDLSLIVRRADVRQGREGVLPYAVEAVAVDHPGIVNQLSSFFTKRNVNIEDLRTDRYPAPHTGTPMFTVHMIVGVPSSQHIGALREEFMAFCDEFNLDAVIEPVKG